MSLIRVIKDIFISKARSEFSQTETDSPPDSYIGLIADRLSSGDISGAEEMCCELLETFPDNAKAISLQHAIHLAIVQDRFPGPNYLEWLAWFHTSRRPGSYVEIGVETGQSLQFAQPPTRAIGIDPAIHIVHSQETWVKLFKLTSDEFFTRHDLQEVLGAGNVDLVFIDGLHTFDQALKDFMNVERFSAPESIVLFHDILPVIPVTAMRERNSTFWVGDTWKVMLILLKYRPDLRIFTIPAFPSGLAVVTNLDAHSGSLHQDFERICQEALTLELDKYLPEIDEHLHVVANNFDAMTRVLENPKT